MTNTATVRLTDPQLTALECAGVFEGDDDLGIRAHVSPDRRRIAAAAASAVCQLSNDLDQAVRDQADAERRRWYATDSRVLANLYSKLLRADRAR